MVEDCIERDLGLVKKLIQEIFDEEKKLDFAFSQLEDFAEALAPQQ